MKTNLRKYLPLDIDKYLQIEYTFASVREIIVEEIQR